MVAIFLAMFLGALLTARAEIELPLQEPVLAASMIGLGAVVVTGTRMPFWLALAVTCLFASYHGSAHGREMEVLAASAALPGLLATCLLLIGVGYVVGRLLTSRVRGTEGRRLHLIARSLS